jgi:copper homeostasis protein
MENQQNILLEICAANFASAQAASLAGADRIELCSALAVGGLTPSHALLEAVQHAFAIPVHVLVRPREGDFLYSDAEFQIMQAEILKIKQMGFAGVVFGILNPDATIDEKRCATLVALAKPMQITFHRAFDFVTQANVALEKLIELGFDYVLSSGLKTTAVLGLTQLTALVAQANNRIQIIPAAGINESNIASIIQTTKANIIHCSLSEEVPSKMQVDNGSNLIFVNAESSEKKIRAVKKIIANISHA